MRARLGFSVAITLHAGLLWIDEVLSVGDARFKKKAEKEMTKKIRSGLTVVIVSHSMPQMRRLCDRIIWLDKGQLREIGDPDKVTENYLNFARQSPSRRLVHVNRSK